MASRRMDLELTEEQALLGDTVAKLIERHCPEPTVRSLVDGGAGFDRETGGSYGAVGLFGLLVPESHGGSSAGADGMVDAALVCEEMGRNLQPGPFVPTLLVAQAVAEGERTVAGT